jgi:hypothetical protein
MLNFSKTIFLLCTFSVCSLSAVELRVLSANQYPNVKDLPVGKENNKKILAASRNAKSSGAVIKVFFKNNSNAAVSLKDISWDSKNIEQWSKNYQLIWYRMQPQQVAPGKVGAVSFYLRDALSKKTEFNISFKPQGSFKTAIRPQMPDFRIMTIAFENGLKKAYVYVVKHDKSFSMPECIFFDGKKLDDASIRWLNKDYAANVKIAEINFPQALKRGERHNFIVQSKSKMETVGATLRAFDNLTVFGSYGGRAFERYAENGLNGYNSFKAESKASLDQAEQYGIKVVSRHPIPEVTGHRALYAYLLMDEPDCKDYTKDPKRPFSKRIGTMAPEMVKADFKYQQKDANTATLLTLDLTFLPYNYFVYSQIADITNPDIYTVTTGWDLKIIDYHTQLVKRSCAPRPFTFSYQGGWEEYTKATRKWTNRSEILKIGWDKLRNTEKIRGFGRPPAPEEVRMSMLYAIGNGARGLFSFWDISCANGNLLFHGSEDLPELWQEIGRTSKSLRRVKALLEISHPVQWANAKSNKVLTKTLFTGSRAALVIAINESYKSVKKGFSTKDAATVFSFSDLPWLRANKIYRVTPGKLIEIKSSRVNNKLTWSDKLKDGEIYLISPDSSVANEIDASANNELKKQKQKAEKRQLQAKACANLIKEIQNKGTSFLGTQTGGYSKNIASFWNPGKKKYNAFEFWQRKGTKNFFVKWKLKITADMVKTPHLIAWSGRFSGAPCHIKITQNKDCVIYSNQLNALKSKVRFIEVSFPEPGNYNLEIFQTPVAPIEHGGAVASSIFLIKSKE